MSEASGSPAHKVYNIRHWSDGYIDVNPQGEVVIRPDRGHSAASINLPELTRRLEQAGVPLPVLIRFTDILHDRVNRLCRAFNTVAEAEGYRGRYTAVYPIKVNQQRRVVEELLTTEPAASAGQVGLEAGSKPELMAVLAMARQPGSVIVCNGYKDREYIRLALIGQKLGHRVFIVVEKQSELPIILEQARQLQVKPLIGVRARLATIGKGNWQNTGGEKSKFGLSASQVLDVVDTLRAAGALDSLQLLHFHLGSQIANIRDIQTGLRECARFYTELHRLGAPIRTVDIGGGLGVDYEGTRSRSSCSMNYSLHEYAYYVIHVLQSECDRHGIPHPDLISESGRALTAHHSVLVTNVIDREYPDRREPSDLPPDAPGPLRDLARDLQSLRDAASPRSLAEIYHDLMYAMADVHSQFAHGLLSLPERAQAETLYVHCCRLLRNRLDGSNRAHREIIDELNEKLADKLFVNFSLFQSLPDVWGIDQIFPVMPINGLDRPLSRRAVIQDITCDSDGRIDHYVDGEGIETTLPLPEDRPGEPLLIGFFMTGAYQEILGDMHNLFGDTHSVDVRLNDRGGYDIGAPIQGDTVAKVLRYVNFEPERLLEAYRHKFATSGLPAQLQETLLAELASGLEGYTYLED
ncbi:biosynthetic arginine decarboxylase [Marinobacter lutaoensis]|jgi:arginine decarboxylase|uniref:Biosynthetic arginine decarboxylase n=1 Tax=Marinobacter lutaoensis TaxID=135739 RepID=A0A1V2DWH8_9GAMM|nr:biosynthetic arginine decarboxylase [Marinobacter lutaoensis]MBI44082.1 biosynthetic arginine decarboxylase [Oceanospirillales bacterium]NVD36961.1 biosynthetic arginine decarboxylase [Marinobacter lutaoensis]ONF44756.1 arginine decarboxylase [Marinobacter lutaoensis]|tara:strand:- start:437 stop:2347 length:1911 start_codon:yes stop_codon:yes gene_type:complete